MKKNLMTVIILALVLVNLVLTAILCVYDHSSDEKIKSADR